MLTTYYMEMRSRAQANFCELPHQARVEPVAPEDFDFNRRLYLDVGQAWGWTDKAAWSDAQWARYVQGHGEQLAAQPVEQIHTWKLVYEGQEAGYFELAQAGQSVELRYFGLLPHALGCGLGGGLLSAAIERAWALEPERVWVHTCSLDHPHALNNYKKRGFNLYHTQTE